MSILNQPDKPTQNIRWASLSSNNGIYNTANKVEPSENHKDYGWGYPEQPTRNTMNWWKNAVYKCIDYLSSFIDARMRILCDNFCYNVTSISGLDITITNNLGTNQAGWVSNGSRQQVATQLTVTVPNNSQYKIYAYHTGSGTLQVGADYLWPLESVSYSWVPLYTINTSAGAIVSIEDHRSTTLIKKASIAEVSAGTDNSKFITPYVLKLGFLIKQATQTIFGSVRLADQTDISSQSGNDVVTAQALSWSQIRATNTGDRYGTVRLSSSTSFTDRVTYSNDVLTIGSFSETNAYATDDTSGFVMRATASDVSTGTNNTKYVPPSLIPTAVSGVIPSGVVMMWSGDTLPDGWMWCDGFVISNSGDTQSLYSVISPVNTALGIAAGTLPDTRGQFIRGFSGTRTSGIPTEEQAANRKLGSYASDKLQNHTHTTYRATTVNNAGSYDFGGGGFAAGAATKQTGVVGTETRPINMALNFIIKK